MEKARFVGTDFAAGCLEPDGDGQGMTSMNHEQPRSLSEVELGHIVQCQRYQIEELTTRVAQLEARMAKLETRLDRLDATGQLSEAEVQVQEEREQATRDALRHLDDVGYLGGCRLARLMARLHGRSPDGYTLHSLLVQAIWETKPPETSSHQTRKCRCHEALRRTYLEKQKAPEITEALGISERQYYRDLKAGILRVVEQILRPRQ